MLEGQTDGVLDDEVLRRTIQECAGNFYEGARMTIDLYEQDGREVENHYLVMADFVTF